MSLNIADLIDENERLSQEGTNNGDFLANFVRMPEGNGAVQVRILPPARKGHFGKEKNPFYQVTRIHRVNGRSIHCPKDLVEGKWKGECPICKYYNWLWQQSEKKSQEEADRMQATARGIKPVERYYYNVIVRQQFNEAKQEMEKNVGPLILSIGKTIHQMIIRAIVGNKELDEAPLGDITDFKAGRDFKIIKTMRQSGRESYPNYSESKFMDVSPLGTPEEVEKWLSETAMHDLSSLRTLKDEDEMKKQLKIHLGLEQDDSAGQGTFDPSEFQKPSVSAATVTVKETVTVAEATPVEMSSVESSVEASMGDESLADDDFIKQLRDMS